MKLQLFYISLMHIIYGIPTVVSLFITINLVGINEPELFLLQENLID
jgi:hypothetical protein